MRGFDGLAVDLGQQNVRNGLKHARGRAFQQVGKAHVQAAFAEPNGVVHIGKRIELDPKLGQRRARPQLAVGCLKDVMEIGRNFSY